MMDGSRPRKMDHKPLLVGEWPPKSGEGPHGPLSARPAHVMAGLLGITYETFLCLFDRVNLLKWWAGERPPRMSSLKVIADGFPMPGAPIVLLGRRVASAMGFEEGFYSWGTLSIADCVVIPHPSGRNLMYNDPAERMKVGDVLREALLFHGKIFRVGEYPHGQGSLVMIQRGNVWGDAERRLRHRKSEDREDA